jgi:hypothetical protein
MNAFSEPGRFGAAALVVLGLQATGGGGVLLLGPGTPAELAEHLDSQMLSEQNLIAAAKDAQAAESPPLIVLGGGAATTAQAVLDEPEIARARLLIAGTGAATDRAALEALPWLSWTRVRRVDLEFVPPRAPEGPVGGLEGGLGLVVLDTDATEWGARTPNFVPMARLLPKLTSAWLPERLSTDELQAGRQAQAELAAITSSASWRVTAPLRAAKQAIRRRR